MSDLSPGALACGSTSGPAALPLARALIRCPSVTPADAGALALLEQALMPLGFSCRRLRFGGDDGTAAVDNLYARLGTAGPNLCFAGHTDVVPPGPREHWRYDPFAAEVADGRLWGRGAADMKGAVAAFVTAVGQYLAEHGTPPGSISLLITGDEEGDAVNGTRKVLAWLAQQGERLDACLVGEPTSVAELGDMIKIGRRGSLNGVLTVRGRQGHVAYPERADNPLPRLARLVTALAETPLDQGTAHFQPSTLAVTSIDVANPASNVIPAQGQVRFNIRFSDRHSAASLEHWLRHLCDGVGGDYQLDLSLSGDAFLTAPGPLSGLIVGAIGQVTGRRPKLSTSGGTSDARFIKDYCPVVEVGPVGASIHRSDEHLDLTELGQLTQIYALILQRYFASSGPQSHDQTP